MTWTGSFSVTCETWWLIIVLDRVCRKSANSLLHQCYPKLPTIGQCKQGIQAKTDVNFYVITAWGYCTFLDIQAIRQKANQWSIKDIFCSEYKDTRIAAMLYIFMAYRGLQTKTHQHYLEKLNFLKVIWVVLRLPESKPWPSMTKLGNNVMITIDNPRFLWLYFFALKEQICGNSSK